MKLFLPWYVVITQPLSTSHFSAYPCKESVFFFSQLSALDIMELVSSNLPPSLVGVENIVQGVGTQEELLAELATIDDQVITGCFVGGVGKQRQSKNVLYSGKFSQVKIFAKMPLVFIFAVLTFTKSAWARKFAPCENSPLYGIISLCLCFTEKDLLGIILNA